jgi:hypothetical protein
VYLCSTHASSVSPDADGLFDTADVLFPGARNSILGLSVGGGDSCHGRCIGEKYNAGGQCGVTGATARGACLVGAGFIMCATHIGQVADVEALPSDVFDRISFGAGRAHHLGQVLKSRMARA